MLLNSKTRPIGLVKPHFYHIWVQHKILRKNHELRGFHKILSEVCVSVSPS